MLRKEFAGGCYPLFIKTKAPSAWPGALANLFLSLELPRASYQDMFSGLATTP